MLNFSKEDGFVTTLFYDGSLLAKTCAVLYARALRTKGLIGSKTFPESSALFFPNVTQFHSQGVLFPFDAVFLKQSGEILSLHPSVPRDTLNISEPTAKHLVELPEGTISRNNLTVGKKLLLGKMK